jgi:hypothetical protein
MPASQSRKTRVRRSIEYGIDTSSRTEVPCRRTTYKRNLR